MVGSAFKIFGPIVNKGYLFKDGTGPDHGEYTHTLQWLAVARARHDGVIKLDFGVCELYKNSTALGAYSPDSEEGKLFASGPEPGARRIGLWEYLVDCFPDPGLEEDISKNILSSTYRTPSVLMTSLRTGSLYSTGVSIWIEIREEERGWVGGKRSKENMREYHIAKQKKKGRYRNFDEGVNTFFPKNVSEDLSLILIKRGFRKDWRDASI